MITSIIVSILDNPFDLIRTRTQFHFISKNDEHRYPKVFEGIRYIYKNVEIWQILWNKSSKTNRKEQIIKHKKQK